MPTRALASSSSRARTAARRISVTITAATSVINRKAAQRGSNHAPSPAAARHRTAPSTRQVSGVSGQGQASMTASGQRNMIAPWRTAPAPTTPTTTRTTGDSTGSSGAGGAAYRMLRTQARTTSGGAVK